MYRYIAVAAAFSFYSMTLKAQIPPSNARKIDTIAHVRERYIEKKDKYINQPLTVLLHDLDLPVSYYMINHPINNKSVCNVLLLSFWNKERTVTGLDPKSPHKPAIINITWTTPVPSAKAYALLSRTKSIGQWGAPEEAWYGQQIVKDLVIIEYPK